MKRVLIYGLKDPVGGVENLLLTYTSCFPKDEIVCDYLMFSCPFSKEEEIRKRGGTVWYLPSRIKRRRAYRREIRRIFEQNRYDAVWVNVAGLTNIDALKYAKRYGVPVRIVHSHGTRLYWTGRLMKYLVPLLHTLHKRGIHRVATHFWACSKPAGEFMFPSRVWQRLRVIHNAVDTAVFCPDDARRADTRVALGLQDAVVVGHIARLCAEKNQDFLLDIFAEVYRKDPRARLLLVGDGDLYAALVDKAQQLGLTEAVIFTGFRTDVADLCRACDVFVLPSLAEGLGLSLIEAQACGVPCVASDAVPAEADVSGYVQFVGLDQPASVWGDTVLSLVNTTIPEPTAAVETAEYSLKQEAQKLVRFFTDKETV